MPDIRTCASTGKQFIVFDQDAEFYKKIGVPLPTLCPEERTRRRFAFRNEIHLYRHTCALTKKPIISSLSPQSPYKVISTEAWWSDDWDAMEYGRPVSWEEPFFQQFKNLFMRVPQISLHTTNNENCPFNNYVAECKNCYLINGSVYCQDCYYGNPYYCNSCVDSLLVRNGELCYECVTCDHCYNCNFCHDCVNCIDCDYCYDCRGCENCFGCAGLRKKSYHIFNKPVSKEIYKEKIKELLRDRQAVLFEFEKQKRSAPHRATVGEKCENVTGDYVYESKNTHYAFDCSRCQDCSYIAQVIDCKDCYDCNYTEENELCYEYIGYYRNNRAFFSTTCFGSNDLWYCQYCMNCSECFGCVGLKRKSYCIFNKQYSADEYKDITTRLIEKMKRAGEFGEFFPMSLSPFPYEDTVAAMYF